MQVADSNIELQKSLIEANKELEESKRNVASLEVEKASIEEINYSYIYEDEYKYYFMEIKAILLKCRLCVGKCI